MLHFVTSYMKQNKSRKQTLESAQYGLEISFKMLVKKFYQRRSITSFKSQLSQGDFLSTNETLNKVSITEAIPLRSSIKS